MSRVWEIRIKGEWFPIRCYYEEDVEPLLNLYRKRGKIQDESDYTVTTRLMEIEPRWDIYSSDYDY